MCGVRTIYSIEESSRVDSEALELGLGLTSGFIFFLSTVFLHFPLLILFLQVFQTVEQLGPALSIPK